MTAPKPIRLAYIEHFRESNYPQESGTYAVLGDLMWDIEQDEHIKAFCHGELNDLIKARVARLEDIRKVVNDDA